jgi:hypothetical protein
MLGLSIQLIMSIPVPAESLNVLNCCNLGVINRILLDPI